MARKASIILSHWHKLFEGFQESPGRIYSLLGEAIDGRKIPGFVLSSLMFLISYLKMNMLAAFIKDGE